MALEYQPVMIAKVVASAIVVGSTTPEDAAERLAAVRRELDELAAWWPRTP